MFDPLRVMPLITRQTAPEGRFQRQYAYQPIKFQMCLVLAILPACLSYDQAHGKGVVLSTEEE